MKNFLRKAVVHFLMTALVCVGFEQSVYAAMVSTEQVVAADAAAKARAHILSALNRADVQAALVRNGIAPQDAQARVAALSDSEASSLSQQIDSLPAGGDGVVGALVLIFFVLLVTDILGLTKVFPFTRSVR